MKKGQMGKLASGWQKLLLLFMFLLLSAVCIWYFASLGPKSYTFALDWKMFWQATHGLQINYADKWIFNPPWTLAVLWPISAFPVYESWGLSILTTWLLLALVLPRSTTLWRWGMHLTLLLVSYPAMRQLSDGNVEFLMLAGFLVLSAALLRGEPWMLAGAFVLLTTKIQESWLTLAVVAIWVLIPSLANSTKVRSLEGPWPRRKALTALALSAAFALPFFAWKGGEWLASLALFPSNSHYNSSLVHTLNGLGAPAWLSIAVWIAVFAITLLAIRRQIAGGPLPLIGLLVTAGMLLAPYSGNSVLLPFALGVMPLVARKPWPFLLLVLLYDLPALGNQTFRAVWEPLYWAGALLITWMVLLLQALKDKGRV